MSIESTAAKLAASATKAIETSLAECHRLELQVIRLRGALREALDGWDAERDIEGHDKHERSVVLRDFLDGKREGL